MFVKIIVLLYSAVQIGLAIRCYDCNSANNSMCLDPAIYDPETIARFLRVTECGVGLQAPAQEFFCRKIKQTIFHKHYEPDVRVTRGCGWVRYHRECYKVQLMVLIAVFHKHYEPDVRVTRGCGWVRYHRECYKADNEDHLETVCQCFGDLCNRSTTSYLTPGVLVAGLWLKMLL